MCGEVSGGTGKCGEKWWKVWGKVVESVLGCKGRREETWREIWRGEWRCLEVCWGVVVDVGRCGENMGVFENVGRGVMCLPLFRF